MPENTGKNAHSQEGVAPATAAGAEKLEIEPDLQSIIELWPELSEAVKADVLALVRVAVQRAQV